jgi:hypothetical protein
VSFAQRQIDVEFALAEDTFPGGDRTLKLTNHRVQASISTQMSGPLAFYCLSLRIYGMKLADMSVLSLWNTSGVMVGKNEVTVTAGDVGGMLYTAFVGTIFSAVVDISDNGEASLVVSAQGGLYETIASAAPNTYPGTQDVASIIGGLAQQAGLAFQNHGVTARLSGQYLSGTIMNQIERVAVASQTIMLLDRNVVHIWPNRGAPDFPEIYLAAGL